MLARAHTISRWQQFGQAFAFFLDDFFRIIFFIFQLFDTVNTSKWRKKL